MVLKDSSPRLFQGKQIKGLLQILLKYYKEPVWIKV